MASVNVREKLREHCSVANVTFSQGKQGEQEQLRPSFWLLRLCTSSYLPRYEVINKKVVTWILAANNYPANNYPASNYPTQTGYSAPAYPTSPLKCWHCDAMSFEECEAKGMEKTCHPNEGSCFLEIRERRQNGHAGPFMQICMGCKSKDACDNMQNQNFQVRRALSFQELTINLEPKSRLHPMPPRELLRRVCLPTVLCF